MTRATLISTTEIAFIDPAVSNFEKILADLRAGVEPVPPDVAKPELSQFSGVLNGRPGTNVIRIGAHYRSVEFGHGWVNASSHAQLSRGVTA
jgi:hypothetical protein